MRGIRYDFAEHGRHSLKRDLVGLVASFVAKHKDASFLTRYNRGRLTRITVLAVTFDTISALRTALNPIVDEVRYRPYAEKISAPTANNQPVVS